MGTLLSNGLAFSSLPAILHARQERDIGATNTLVFPFLCGNCLGMRISSGSLPSEYCMWHARIVSQPKPRPTCPLNERMNADCLTLHKTELR